MTAYLLERAWLGEGPVVADVLVRVDRGRFTEVTVGGADPAAEPVPGLTLPGLANCHSHAFHRALRGRTQRERGTFWTWREQMYALAGRLTPDTYYALALATYQEMAAAGVTSVGEFHYLHHATDGRQYDEPNAMGLALVEAARDAGLRIALLDTCYLSAGLGRAPEGVQTRFTDGDADRWAARADELAGTAAAADVVVGAAVHSVRAVPREQIGTVAGWAAGRDAPLHVHVSEQVAENEQCLAAYGRTPAEVLADAAALGPRTSAVHATHLTDGDVKLLGQAGAFACFCPTTERDLGDGIGPSRRLHDAGAVLTVGSDSHAVIDPFEEMRAVELDERLGSRERGHWVATELLRAATADGHRSLGFPDAGRIAVGDRADLVTVDTGSVRTAGAGADEQAAVFAATAADVVRVLRDGRDITPDRGRLGSDLDRVIEMLWERR